MAMPVPTPSEDPIPAGPTPSEPTPSEPTPFSETTKGTTLATPSDASPPAVSFMASFTMYIGLVSLDIIIEHARRLLIVLSSAEMFV